MIDLAAKMPDLETLEWVGGGDEWTPSTGRPTRFCRSNKAIFAEVLTKCLMNFLFPLDHVQIIDQRAGLPNMVAPSLQGDPFSTALRTLSYHLCRLDLRVLADSTLFWPSAAIDATPSWPNLETLSICLHAASPSGHWYFQGPEGERPHTSA
ncbi:hypothetical protein BU23DRAFT_60745 [Bimuria novae-zelandiae CBS 107.79]|uniref:Uncharacterized protein n=1 Tax=Bimuria novae-zelandiae CBS 107.79 TaxID=1447943 RepID=A0A6A5VHC4_9PLEO|nr:hypothetical protein BU23DRAFT_60745 [Bimuria novae-zelandiae CBS 107.79]